MGALIPEKKHLTLGCQKKDNDHMSFFATIQTRNWRRHGQQVTMSINIEKCQIMLILTYSKSKSSL